MSPKATKRPKSKAQEQEPEKAEEESQRQESKGPSRRMIIIFAHGGNIVHSDIAATDTLGDVKVKAKRSLQKRFSLQDEVLGESDDLWLASSAKGFLQTTDDDTVEIMAPTQGEPVVPRPPSSLLFPLKPAPAQQLGDGSSQMELILRKLQELESKLETEQGAREKAEERFEEDLKQEKEARKKAEEKLEKDLREEKEARETIEKELAVEKDARQESEKQFRAHIDGLNAELQSTNEDVGEIMWSLAKNDEKSLATIKKRNLLDRMQTQLAQALKLPADPTLRPSLVFRQTLGEGTDLAKRRDRLEALLKDHSADLGPAQALIGHGPALDMLAERNSPVRLRGDLVAHGNFDRGWYEGSIQGSGVNDVALRAILNCVDFSKEVKPAQ
ncbi:hypothetical protein EST38_g5491 [Candolleomyces aberdarensis]|uniref:Uncharacterized protein n=1 Tax=Candolleomyces aberdarensis TaxID=2316362 RepID=A0A4Q2DJY0_9AGAR|nr:hypothetical protein EST38_g5491 [Candolleomyces aberdarensis]